MQVEKPGTVARYALNIETEGLPTDFYENYIKNINAVTPDDVMRVANKYFLQDNLRILVVGKGSEVIAGLESTKIPMFYFDKFGNPTEKPAMKKPVPAGVTAKTVIDAYVAAIGGDKAVKSVKSIAYTGSTTIPQAPMPLSYSSKMDSKGRMMVELSMAGMGSIMKQVVNGNTGYMMQQGQKKVLEGEELAKMKESAVLFNETLLATKTGVTISGIEPMNGSDAYAVVDGDTTYYFDVKSGLKTAEASTEEQGGQKMTRVTNFNDYRAVKGVKVPFNTIMNVGFELDIISALAEELKRPIEFKQYAFDSLIPGLLKGDFDFAMNGLEINQERQEKIRFSKPFSKIAFCFTAATSAWKCRPACARGMHGCACCAGDCSASPPLQPSL